MGFGEKRLFSTYFVHASSFKKVFTTIKTFSKNKFVMKKYPLSGQPAEENFLDFLMKLYTNFTKNCSFYVKNVSFLGFKHNSLRGGGCRRVSRGWPIQKVFRC